MLLSQQLSLFLSYILQVLFHVPPLKNGNPNTLRIAVIVDQLYMGFNSQQYRLNCYSHHVHNDFLMFFFLVYTGSYNIGFLIYNGISIDEYQKGNFAKEIALVKGIGKTFNISKNETNIGIITYSSGASVRLSFGDVSSQAALESSLDAITISGSGRNIARALLLAQTDLFNQSTSGQIKNVLVVLTDGSSDDAVAASAHALRGSGISVITVGIGQYVRGQLNEMASVSHSDNVFTVTSYSELGIIMGILKDSIVKGNC